MIRIGLLVLILLLSGCKIIIGGQTTTLDPFNEQRRIVNTINSVQRKFNNQSITKLRRWHIGRIEVVRDDGTYKRLLRSDKDPLGKTVRFKRPGNANMRFYFDVSKHGKLTYLTYDSE